MGEKKKKQHNTIVDVEPLQMQEGLFQGLHLELNQSGDAFQFQYPEINPTEFEDRLSLYDPNTSKNRLFH